MQTDHHEGAAILQAAAERTDKRSFRSILKKKLSDHWRPVIKDGMVSCEGCSWSAEIHDSAGKASYRFIRHVAWLTASEMGIDGDDLGPAVAFLSDAMRGHRPHRHPGGSYCLDKQCTGMVFTSANKASTHQCDAVVRMVAEASSSR